MKLEPGSRVAHYEIMELIGKGGMGEVYRATDARLPREVALKTSSVQFSDRFAREAKVIASLNHPNVCTLFDVGPDFLVMEMIEGLTLSECIASGPMGVDEAVSIMRQVADALEYAHERGVIHRDLRPCNIKIRPDGVVKVLDFGLAKVAAVEPAGVADAKTIGSDVTETGVVLGTTAYMSPEQVLGKAVDRRADVWAFGVVFYELLTGARMHQGASRQEVMAAVLKDVPDLKKVPPQVRRLLSRCLEKDPNKRLRHVGDVMALLDDESPSALPVATRTAATSSSRWLWPAIAALAIAVVGAIVLWPQAEGPAPIPAQVEDIGFEVPPSEGMTFNPGAAMTVSPDGRWMVFQANGTDGVTRFWLRSLGSSELRPLPGTEIIGQRSPPAFWSFDSKWVVFAVRERRMLWKQNIQGGPPEPIAQFPAGLNGASWNSDGVIIAGTSDSATPILKVPASGGQEPVAATVLGPTETNHLFPQFLPDEKHFLYLRVSPDPARMGIYIGDIGAKPEDQSAERLLDTDRQAYYAASPGESTGHLVFMRQSTLMAQPFDPVTMKLSGHAAAIPGVERVDSYPTRNYGVFSVSNTGTLAYRAVSAAQMQLTWYDATGRRQETFGEPGEYANPAISPDGRRVAVAVGPEPLRDIDILEVGGTRKTRFTFNPARDDYPSWSPKGKTIAFSSNRSGQLDLYVGAADSPGQEELLLHTDASKDESRFTNDGRFLLFASVSLKTARDIWVLPMGTETKGKEVALVKDRLNQRHARVSPDGRWLAYMSVESGLREVWVRRFASDAPADSVPKWQVSNGGGDFPAWRSDSRALYYTTTVAQMMTAEIDTTQSYPQPMQSRNLFTAPLTADSFGWDLSSDGKRFLFITEPGGGRTIPFKLKTNWATALNRYS